MPSTKGTPLLQGREDVSTMVVGLYGGIIIKQIRQAQIGAISCIH